MPKTPTGARRPADVIGNAVHVMRIATGQVDESERPLPKESARKAGLAGAKARNIKLTKAEKTRIAKKAAKTRWKSAARSD